MTTDATGTEALGFRSPLYALLVKGRALPGALTVATGMSPELVASSLAAAADAGLASERRGRAAGWFLTREGRDLVQQTIALERDGLDLDEAARCYDGDFLPVNAELKSLCTRWQLHQADPGEDLAGLHVKALRFLAQLGDAHPHLDHFAPRLSAALDRVRAGDHRALVRPLSDSYHDVWIELHADLLLWLGRGRDEDD